MRSFFGAWKLADLKQALPVAGVFAATLLVPIMVTLWLAKVI